jgi:isopentenyl-diphosphate delta-isomerase
MKTHVILVDTNDEEIGLMPKLEAHQRGALHRAFSIFIFNSNGELMMQKRAFEKYHSGGLWTNTCCSHPITNEFIQKTANIRLMEEMGISCELKNISKFIYKAELENGLTEYEYDYLFIGYSNNVASINIKEAIDWKWMKIEDIKKDLILNPELYTAWFKPAFEHVLKHLLENII